MNKNKLRRMLKRKKPAFNRVNSGLVRVGFSWRKPKGVHGKLRQHEKSRGFLPQPGYGSPKEVRGMHPTGLKEVMVNNPSEINGLKADVHIIRIGGTVGNLKRNAIQNAAEKAGLKIVNPRKITIRFNPKETKK